MCLSGMYLITYTFLSLAFFIHFRKKIDRTALISIIASEVILILDAIFSGVYYYDIYDSLATIIDSLFYYSVQILPAYFLYKLKSIWILLDSIDAQQIKRRNKLEMIMSITFCLELFLMTLISAIVYAHDSKDLDNEVYQYYETLYFLWFSQFFFHIFLVVNYARVGYFFIRGALKYARESQKGKLTCTQLLVLVLTLGLITLEIFFHFYDDALKISYNHFNFVEINHTHSVKDASHEERIKKLKRLDQINNSYIYQSLNFLYCLFLMYFFYKA